MDNLSHRSFVDFIFEFIISLIAASWADALSLTIVVIVSRRIWLFSCRRGAVVVSGVGAWYKEGSEAALQFRSPRNSGLQGPPYFQPLNIKMCRRFEPPVLQTTLPYMAIQPFIFFRTHHFWEGISIYIASMKYQINTKINSCGKIISSFLKD